CSRDHRGRSEHDVRRAGLDDGSAARGRFFFERAGRSGHVELAVELPLESGSVRDTARWIHHGICSEELDVDLELWGEFVSVSGRNRSAVSTVQHQYLDP